jgi:hypothetical protein
MDRNVLFHLAEILIVYPRTRSALVIDEFTNKVIQVSLSNYYQDADTGHLTHEHIPKSGTKVYLTYSNRIPSIMMGYTPISRINAAEDNKIKRKITHVNMGDVLLDGAIAKNYPYLDGHTDTNEDMFGANDPLYQKDVGEQPNFSGNSFDDLMAGDHVLSTKDGNMIGVLEGGLTYFKASELCQIIGIRYNDTMRIVSRNFEHFSDFGESSYKNSDGHTSFEIKGSASQAHSRLGKYTCSFAMGKRGELIKLSTLSPTGQEHSHIHLTADRAMSLFSQGSYRVRSMGDKLETIKGTSSHTQQGNATFVYKSDHSTSIEANHSHSVSGQSKWRVIKDFMLTVGKSMIQSIGGTRTTDILGSLTSEADVTTITNGSKKETITLLGSFKRLILGSGNIEEQTSLGNISQEILSAGNITRKTTAGDIKDETILGNVELKNALASMTISIDGTISAKGPLGEMSLSPTGEVSIKNKVGSITIDPLGNVSIDNPLMVNIGKGANQSAILGEMFMTFFNTHIHPTGVGPSGPPVVPMSPAQLSTKVKVTI